MLAACPCFMCYVLSSYAQINPCTSPTPSPMLPATFSQCCSDKSGEATSLCTWSGHWCGCWSFEIWRRGSQGISTPCSMLVVPFHQLAQDQRGILLTLGRQASRNKGSLTSPEPSAAQTDACKGWKGTQLLVGAANQAQKLLRGK